LVVSSQDVLDDFARYYKLRKDLNVHVFPFVSVIDNLENINIDDLKTKYNLPDKYFLVSNQFHKHKNHKVLLLTLAKLKEMGIRKHIAFTGKFPGATDSPYLAELHRIIEDNRLQDQVTMLGVISRNDQLQIMKHSQAVLQPSLFEGWSTVIEDAKSLQVPVIASDLKVNIEQLRKDGVYFSPNNPDELASILMKYPERNLNDVFYEDYSVRIKDAAKTLVKIFSR
jgi:glycosyltransferase involved in cell wall biosynthesis